MRFLRKYETSGYRPPTKKQRQIKSFTDRMLRAIEARKNQPTKVIVRKRDATSSDG